MNSKDLLLYSINKKIFFDFERGGLIAKFFRFLIKRTYSVFRIRVRPLISERGIEYPLLFSYLPKGAEKILDFGCVEDTLPIQLAMLGYDVTGMDFRDYPLMHDNFEFVRQDIFEWEPIPNTYDVVTSVSTIEHVGLGSYQDPRADKGDRLAINKLFESLKSSGLLILTLPAGKPCVKRGMRIYDDKQIRSIVPNIQVLRFFMKETRYGQWRETDAETISQLQYENYELSASVQGFAFIVSKKP